MDALTKLTEAKINQLRSEINSQKTFAIKISHDLKVTEENILKMEGALQAYISVFEATKPKTEDKGALKEEVATESLPSS